MAFQIFWNKGGILSLLELKRYHDFFWVWDRNWKLRRDKKDCCRRHLCLLLTRASWSNVPVSMFVLRLLTSRVDACHSFGHAVAHSHTITRLPALFQGTICFPYIFCRQFPLLMNMHSPPSPLYMINVCISLPLSRAQLKTCITTGIYMVHSIRVL